MKNRNFCYNGGRKFFELCWFWKKFAYIIRYNFFGERDFLFLTEFFGCGFLKKQELCHFERSLGNLALFFGEFGGFCH